MCAQGRRPSARLAGGEKVTATAQLKENNSLRRLAGERKRRRGANAGGSGCRCGRQHPCASELAPMQACACEGGRQRAGAAAGTRRPQRTANPAALRAALPPSLNIAVLGACIFKNRTPGGKKLQCTDERQPDPVESRAAAACAGWRATTLHQTNCIWQCTGRGYRRRTTTSA
jgi:hypothetical protein